MPPLTAYKSNSPFPQRFPFEIEKRILFLALALPPYYPSKDITDGEFTTHDLAGQTGRTRKACRRQVRRDTQMAALRCMGVCKAWKGEAAKYLYAEPYLTSDNFWPFAQALLRGDKRWSDINIHPESTPGRWVTTIDLSTLHLGETTLHSTVLASSCSIIFSLVPYLQHLELPAGLLPASLLEVTQAAFAPRLKSLFGLEVDYESHEDIHGRPRSVATDLVRRLPSLELLGLLGPGHMPNAQASFDRLANPPKLCLDRLHSLFLQDINTGLELVSLIDADLPSLRRLYITSFHRCVPDLTQRFQQAHGGDVQSLVYLPQGHLRDPRRTTPPAQTLEWHPKLTHLATCGRSLQMLTTCPSTGLQHLGIPKPKSTDHTGAATDVDPTEVTLQHLTQTHGNGPSIVTLDGCRWVKPHLGETAMLTGDSGKMRRWAERLRVAGIELRDMDGRPAPNLGKLGSSSGSLSGFGGTDRSRRRRSSEYKKARTRPEKLEEDGA